MGRDRPNTVCLAGDLDHDRLTDHLTGDCRRRQRERAGSDVDAKDFTLSQGGKRSQCRGKARCIRDQEIARPDRESGRGVQSLPEHGPGPTQVAPRPGPLVLVTPTRRAHATSRVEIRSQLPVRDGDAAAPSATGCVVVVTSSAFGEDSTWAFYPASDKTNRPAGTTSRAQCGGRPFAAVGGELSSHVDTGAPRQDPDHPTAGSTGNRAGVLPTPGATRKVRIPEAVIHGSCLPEVCPLPSAW